MTEFIGGLTLSERFFTEIAQPLLNEYDSGLKYSAGLIGSGSDVLGYDDEVSADHDWGPRFYLFLNQNDMSRKQEIFDYLASRMPYSFMGYSVNFSDPDPSDGGVRCAQMIDRGKVSPLIFIHVFEEYLREYLGIADLSSLTYLDWLAFSEHKLLSLISSRIFVDHLHINAKLAVLRYYPDDVKLYLLASNWALIAEEQAFVKRCADRGDEAGSIIICARIVERLMRQLFIYHDKYTPYSKWFGTAFTKLPVDSEIKNYLYAALQAKKIQDREDNLVMAQKMIGDLHNTLKLTKPVEVKIQSYFTRNIRVIYPDRLVEALMEKIQATPLSGVPLIGTISQIGNLTSLFNNPEYSRQIKGLYHKV